MQAFRCRVPLTSQSSLSPANAEYFTSCPLQDASILEIGSGEAAHAAYKRARNLHFDVITFHMRLQWMFLEPIRRPQRRLLRVLVQLL